MIARLTEFYDVAALAGHDAARLDAGEEIVSYLTLATVDDVRRLLSRANGEQRRRRQETFFHPAIAMRRRLGQGTHDRCEAVVFADGTVDPADERGLGNHMPAHVKAISVREKTLAPGEVWDVSVRGAQWGLDDMEELYVVVNVGTLRLGRGASVVVRGNVFALVCEHLVSEAASASDDPPTVGVLATPFSVDFGHGSLNGPPGHAGCPGARGADGVPLQVERTIIGLKLQGELDEAGMAGSAGGDGTAGGRGADGRNGGMCKIAEITVRELDGHVTVFAQAGAGGAGGDGGPGGGGGAGGDGAAGRALIRGVIPAGLGGGGGRGAGGGRGGDGGSGGVSSNVYVTVPAAAEAQVTCIGLPSEAGAGGAPGPGGPGGAAGAKADEAPRALTDPARPGEPGAPGKAGRDGRRRPAPAIFLNERSESRSVLHHHSHSNLKAES